MPRETRKFADLRLLVVVGLVAVAVGGCDSGLSLSPASSSAPPHSGPSSAPPSGPAVKVAFGSFTLTQPAGFTVTSHDSDKTTFSAPNGASVSVEHIGACSGGDMCPTRPLDPWLLTYLSTVPDRKNPTTATQLEPEHGSSAVRIRDIVPAGADSAAAQYGIDYDVVLEPAVAVVLTNPGHDSLLVTGSQFVSDVDTGAPRPDDGLDDAIVATLRGLTMAG